MLSTIVTQKIDTTQLSISGTVYETAKELAPKGTTLHVTEIINAIRNQKVTAERMSDKQIKSAAGYCLSKATGRGWYYRQTNAQVTQHIHNNLAQRFPDQY